MRRIKGEPKTTQTMFSFFSSPAPRDYAFLGTDMHSHLLPGIDDGAPDVETAVALVKGLLAMGFERFIATPHVMAELHPNTPASIRAAEAELQAALAEEGLDVPLTAAAEYMIDEQFHDYLQSEGELLTLPGNRVLVELPQAGEPPRWEEAIFRLQLKGYRVILAHPERYRFLAGDFDRFERLQDSGVELQLNLLSLAGYYGQGPERSGKEILKRGLAAFLGTDCHHDRHRHALEMALTKKKLMRSLVKQEWGNSELWLSPTVESVEQTNS